MKKLIDWISEKRWRSSLSHVLLSIPIFIIVYGVGTLLKLESARFVAAAFVVAWWWSREKTQHEYSEKGSDRTITVWHKGWIPFEWDRYSMLDFFLPALVCLAVTLIITGS